MARSDDIRNDIKARLEATGIFSMAITSGLPEEYGVSAGELCVAAIDLSSDETTDLWDGGDQTGLQIDEKCRVTLIVRNADPVLRDRQLDLARNALKNAINGQSLAEITVPDKTYVKSSRQLPPKAPERRIEATVIWRRLQTGWDDADETP